MSTTNNLDRVKELAGQIAEREGCLLYDLEFVGKGSQRILRVYIDKESGAVDIDDCAKVSNGLNELLDTDEEIIPGGAYNLEVSSPGLERALKEPWQYKLVKGQTIWLKLQNSLKDQGIEVKKFKTSKVVTANLVDCDESEVKLAIDGQEIVLPFNEIEKAKTVFEYGTKTGAKR